MKALKSVVFGISLTLAASLAAYGQDQTKPISSAEKNSLAIISAIDKNEILVSVVAENKKVDSDVKDFAEMMIEQHGSNLTQILTMENQLKTGALSSSEADKLSQQGKQDLVKLGALQGDEFAKAYADAMVKGHEAALKLITDKLMKTAKSDEVKNFLADTRNAVEKHLEHAKKMQKEVNS